MAWALAQAEWQLGDLRKILHNWWPLHLVTTAIDPLCHVEGLAPEEQGPRIPKISEPGCMTEVSALVLCSLCSCPQQTNWVILSYTSTYIGTYFYILLHTCHEGLLLMDICKSQHLWPSDSWVLKSERLDCYGLKARGTPEDRCRH